MRWQSFELAGRYPWRRQSLELLSYFQCSYILRILPDSPALKAVWTCKFYCLLSALQFLALCTGSLEIPLWYGVARICLHPDAPWHSSSLLWSHFFALTTRDRQIYQHPTTSKDSLPQQGKNATKLQHPPPPARARVYMHNDYNLLFWPFVT